MALGWARSHALTVVAERFSPRYRARLAVDDPAGDRIDRVALCRGEPDIAAESAHDFVTRNRDCLFLTVGRQEDDGLRESALGGVTEDEETLRIWRRIARDAKAAMHLGATVRNPQSGATQPAPRHLHTPGAHELATRGMTMLAAAGWNVFDFDDCRTASSGAGVPKSSA
jgi:hypothetical protein